MGQLSSVFAEWQTKMPSQLGGSDVLYHLGAHLLNASERPPWIVWVPADDSYAPPLKQDSTVPKAGPANLQGKNNPRNLYTKSAGVEVHCWWRNIDETEELVRASVEAMQKVAPGSYSVVRGAWDREGATAESGIEYVLLIAILVPVTMSPDV